MTNKIQTYTSPFESPLEEVFDHNIIKYLDDRVTLYTQVEINTICGKFRLDFLAQTPKGMKVAFECDGKEYHEESRDEWRDAMILGANEVDAIYRIRGSDITYHVEDIIYIISQWNPEIFSSRGLINLDILASSEIKLRKFNPFETSAIVTYKHNNSSLSGISFICLERRHKNNPKGRRQFWQAAYRFASKMGGGCLDEIISKYRAIKKPN